MATNANNRSNNQPNPGLVINGQDIAELLIGSAKDDTIDGNRGNDFALLGAGNDLFIWDPGDGSDTVEGGSGRDTMQFNGSNVSENFDFSANDDRLRFFRNVGSIVMDTNSVEHVDLNTLGGSDHVTINDLEYTDVKTININLEGVKGSKLGDGAKDSVTIEGTTERDRIKLSSDAEGIAVEGLAAKVNITYAEYAQDILRVNANGGNDSIDASNLGADKIQLVLDGGFGNDKIIGSQGVETVYGGEGNDTVAGQQGDDTAYLGQGDDIFIWNPGDGSDVVEGDEGKDTLRFNGSNGDEVMQLSTNGDRLKFLRDLGNINMDLGGIERVEVEAKGGNDLISANLPGNTAPANVEFYVDGGDGNDTIAGGNGNDTLYGGDGNDVVDGNRGNDTAYLGKGDDLFIWDPGDGSDFINGGEDYDTMRFNGAGISENFDFSANGDFLRFFRDVGAIVMDTTNVEQVDLNTLGGNDNVTINNLKGTDVKAINIDLGAPNTNGGDGAEDTITVNGTHRKDTIDISGDASGIAIEGLAAKVTIVDADYAYDRLVVNGEGGNDNIDASGLAKDIIQLSLNGGAGKDTLTGSQGNDAINGGEGNDLIIAGYGNDTVTGGTGRDAFRFNALDEGVDTITDFVSTEDVIQIDAIGFQLNWQTGAISADQFYVGLGATDASDRFIYNDKTGDLFFDADGWGNGAAVKLATLTGAPSLSAQNIVVV